MSATPRRSHRTYSEGYLKSLIKLIHVAKRELSLDDPTYRAMLDQLTGQPSAKGLTGPQLERVVDHLRRKGFQAQAGRGGPKVEMLADDPQSRMIRALWLQLHDLGQVRDPGELALARFVQRQTHISRLEWLSTAAASSVIEALKAWVIRAGGELL
ncbi:gp16 family protein [Desulfocurvus vexinensis]|uniref:gp16 family protein n=1 Tax=Desulfocurvus vexinensis TaxID=399548 RepID=UPI000687BC98|nr:regulatory protein GemA [Desulfocurvus vexinensis]